MMKCPVAPLTALH